MDITKKHGQELYMGISRNTGRHAIYTDITKIQARN